MTYKVKNKNGVALIVVERLSSHGQEVSRLTKNGGRVNLGRVFSRQQVKAIKKFVSSSDRYLTWDGDWKPFLRALPRDIVNMKVQRIGEPK